MTSTTPKPCNLTATTRPNSATISVPRATLSHLATTYFDDRQEALIVSF